MNPNPLVLYLFALGFGLAGWVAPAYGASPIDILDFPDTHSEARYRDLIDEFRCPKCLNNNLSGSDAPIAKDLRTTVHRLLVVDGYTDQQIRDYLQSRYGDFVLYDPPFKPSTYVLWLGPVVFLLIALIALIRLVRNARTPQALSDDEQKRLLHLLDDTP